MIGNASVAFFSNKDFRKIERQSIGCSSQKVAPAPGTRDRSGVGVLTEIATEPVTPHFKPEP